MNAGQIRRSFAAKEWPHLANQMRPFFISDYSAALIAQAKQTPNLHFVHAGPRALLLFHRTHRVLLLGQFHLGGIQLVLYLGHITRLQIGSQ